MFIVYIILCITMSYLYSYTSNIRILYAYGKHSTVLTHKYNHAQTSAARNNKAIIIQIILDRFLNIMSVIL